MNRIWDRHSVSLGGSFPTRTCEVSHPYISYPIKSEGLTSGRSGIYRRALDYIVYDLNEQIVPAHRNRKERTISDRSTHLRRSQGRPGGRPEARNRRHPGFRRRTRQAILCKARLAARRRFRRPRRLPRDPVHPARLQRLCHLRQERHLRRARLRAGPVSGRLRHRSGPQARCSAAASRSAKRFMPAATCTSARTSRICSGGSG